MRIHLVVAMFLGWIFPGSGHAYFRKYWTSILCSFSIFSLLGIGLYLTQGVFVAQEHFPFYLLGKYGSGLVYVVHTYLTVDGVISSDSPFHYFEIGILFISLAGLFNLVTVLHLIDIFHDRPSLEDLLKKEQADDQEEMEGEEETSMLYMIRDHGEMFVVAFIMALVIRCFFVEVFKIPSGSMEPTLMGNAPAVERQGDRIMVNKFHYEMYPVNRFDVIVFRYPLNVMRNFIKRAVGIGGESGEYLRMWKGNVYVSKREEGSFRLARKPLETQKKMWIPFPPTREVPRGRDITQYWQTGPDHTPKHADFLRLEANNQPAEIQFRKPIFDGPVTIEDLQSLSREGDHPVTDVNIRATIRRVSRGTEMKWLLYDRGRRFVLKMIAGKSATLTMFKNQEKHNVVQIPAMNTHWKSRSNKLSFFLTDGRVGGILNGERLFLQSYKTEYRKVKRYERRKSRPQRPKIIVEEGAVDVATLQVFRDVYYHWGGAHSNFTKIEEPVFVPPHRFLVIGDNVNNSRDSRKWKEVVVTVGDQKNEEKERTNNGSTEQYEIDLTGSAQGGTWEEPMIQKRKTKHGIKRIPYVYDNYGRKIKKPSSNILEKEIQPVKFVPERNLVGKALWVWWPPWRAKMIR